MSSVQQKEAVCNLWEMDRVHVERRPPGLRDAQEIREEGQQEAEKCENELEYLFQI